jgi:glycyl-tRNA synthetase
VSSLQNGTTDKIIALAKKRGFYWQAFEAYGGAGGFFVLGDLGVKLKENIVKLWKKIFLEQYGFVEIESPTIVPYAVLEASGHVESFKDALAECLNCHNKYRADHILEEHGQSVSEAIKLEDLEKLFNASEVKCPNCEGKQWKVSPFMTMFQTNIGPYTGNAGFLRPETAQGMFVEFKQIYESNRTKMPIGVAQIGKVYRNEISPRQGFIRLREFAQMELELFFNPSNSKCPYLTHVNDIKMNILDEQKITSGDKVPNEVTAIQAIEGGMVKQEWLAFFMALSEKFMEELGVTKNNQRFKAKLEGERAHYSAQTYDHEVLLEKYGWTEIAGHAYRQDYDLKSHTAKGSIDLHVIEDLEKPYKAKNVLAYLNPIAVRSNFPDKAPGIFKQISQFDPKVLAHKLQSEGRVSLGGVVLGKEAFTFKEIEETVSTRKYIPHVVEPSFGVERIIHSVLEHAYREKEERVILSLNAGIAPYKYAVFPLMSKDGLDIQAQELHKVMDEKGITSLYDDDGSIGRRYARADEIGIPKAITIDYQTLEDGTVTLRDRDSWNQIRVKLDELKKNL